MRTIIPVATLLSLLTWTSCTPTTTTPSTSAPEFELHTPRGAASTLEGVRRIVSQQMGVDFNIISATTSLGELKVDELDFVELIMELEEGFSIVVSDEAAEKMMGSDDWQQAMQRVTIGELVALVEQLKSK